MWIFPLAAMLVSGLFSGVVGRQYRRRRSPALLSWSVALFVFGIASACDFIGTFSGWSSYIAKIYFLTGATVVVGYLGLGTMYLLAPKRVARAWLAFMLIATVVGVILLSTASVDAKLLRSAAEPGWKAIRQPWPLAALVVSVNSLGTLILVGGAAFSAVFRRYPLANGLIAGGALITASGGTLTRFGHYQFQEIGQAAGITVMFAGFLLAGSRNKQSPGQPAAGRSILPRRKRPAGEQQRARRKGPRSGRYQGKHYRR